MHILGVLVRTRHSPFGRIAFQYAEEILQASRDGGHVFIDLAAEMATKENVMRILRSIGRPNEPLLKLVVFYCDGSSNSPVDQLGQEFVTDETLPAFSDWGIYCIGCSLGQALGHRLLTAGAHFLIGFSERVGYTDSNEEETFKGLNAGIVQMLREGIGPSAATDYMRQFFENTRNEFSVGSGRTVKNAFLRALTALWNAENLVCYEAPSEKDANSLGPEKGQPITLPHSGIAKEPDQIRTGPKVAGAQSELAKALDKIEPGPRQAHEYEQIVAEILRDAFSPDLDEPDMQVTNDSGSSRYDITFDNRAEHGFWHDIKIRRGNSLAIFDAKNKKGLDPSDADQMLRYASEERGNVVFIVCRGEPSRAFTVRAADLLKEKRVCLIVLTDTHLKEIHALKQQGANPTIVVQRLYRKRIQGS